MIVGYARVDRDEEIGPQLTALRAAGCETIFEDSGVPYLNGGERPGLKAALDAVSTFDSFIVCRLDRLDGSLSVLVELLAEFVRYGIGFRSLEDGIDTTGQKGRFELPLLTALAAVDRATQTKRIAPSLDEAIRLPGRAGPSRTGRKPKLTPDQARLASKLIADGELRQDVARVLGVSLPTLRSALRRHHD